MRLLKVILFLGVLCIFLPGASCPPRDIPVKRETPEKTLLVLREALVKEDYSTAYYSLCKSSRQRYSYGNFKLVLEWTIFGVLIKSMLINWNIKSVKYYNESNKTPKIVEKAKVLLQHWKYPDYQKEFVFINEDDGWRMELTLAGFLGMPQEDEDRFSPVPAEENEEK